MLSSSGPAALQLLAVSKMQMHLQPRKQMPATASERQPQCVAACQVCSAAAALKRGQDRSPAACSRCLREIRLQQKFSFPLPTCISSL